MLKTKRTLAILGLILVLLASLRYGPSLASAIGRRLEGALVDYDKWTAFLTGCGVAGAVAYWIHHRRMQQELYLDLLKQLDSKTQTSLAGAAAQLLDLDRYKRLVWMSKYARPIVVALECAICEHSQDSLRTWTSQLHEDLRRHQPGKKRTNNGQGWTTTSEARAWAPAISEAVYVIARIREASPKRLPLLNRLPPLQLSAADLRSLTWGQFVELLLICKPMEGVHKLDKADLRHLTVPGKTAWRSLIVDLVSLCGKADRPLDKDEFFYKAEGLLDNVSLRSAWISIPKKQIEVPRAPKELADLLEKKIEEQPDIDDMQLGSQITRPYVDDIRLLLKKEAAIVLEGDWSDYLHWAARSKGEWAIDLSGQRIAGAPGAIFSKLDLSGCDFSNGLFMGAKFTGAILDGAKFAGADVSGADFRDAKFDKAVDRPHDMFQGARTWKTIGL